MSRIKPKSNRACFPVGHLTTQVWNVSQTGNTEQKRGQIQFKYGSLQSDLETLLKNNAETVGTFLGDIEEFGLTHVLNKNKDSKMWKILLPNEKDFSNYYAVKVSTHQLSTLSNKKVKTKSDAYVVKADIDRKILLEKQFVLDESDIKDINYEVVPGTGISIKLKDSKHFSYQKFTSNSFKLAFSDIEEIEFWLVSLLIYSKDEERHKNNKIISDFDYDLEQYLQKVHEKMGIEINDVDNKQFWDSIRQSAQKFIKEKIQSDQILKFSITTGSGRSKGKYTIEIK